MASMQGEDVQIGKQFKVESSGEKHGITEEAELVEEPAIVDLEYLSELNGHIKTWEHKQVNAVEHSKQYVMHLPTEKLNRTDFLHFVLQNAPVIIGHQDKELRYRFIYNYLLIFEEKDIIGKTDVEIFNGDGIKELQEFKREVLKRGLPAKREVTLDTPFLGTKTFIVYVEPVFSKAGEAIGVNYIGMDVTPEQRADPLIEQEKCGSNNPSVSTPEEFYDKLKGVYIDSDWKERAMHLQNLSEESIPNEQTATGKLQEIVKHRERQSSFVEEDLQIRERADNFLHSVLQNAPVILGHQDKELCYRYIYNYFPSLEQEDIIGKTDVEIFTGSGVKESLDFKREVLERGVPAKREITFHTPLFGAKTFLMHVEPVFDKAGETVGVNYMGMDVTDQVRKRAKIAMIRKEMALQKIVGQTTLLTVNAKEENVDSENSTDSFETITPLFQK